MHKLNPGFFGIGVYHPKRAVNVGSLWRSAAIYGAAFVFTVGRRYTHQISDTLGVPYRIPLFNYPDLATAKACLPYAARLVCVELDGGAIDLAAFEHPRTAVYLLGAEDHGLPPRVLDAAVAIVRIPSPAPVSLNVAVAGSLVIYDRFAKAQHGKECNP